VDPVESQSHVAVAAPLQLEHPALTRYRLRNRRAMRIYAAVIALLIVLGFVAVRIAYAHGDLNKVSSTVATAPAPIPVTQTASRLTASWGSADHPAVGSPYSDGIVVTWAGHTVTGRDAVTGAPRWHYTRSNVSLCSVDQQDRSTIAIYRRNGNCDQVTGFETVTGKPKWYRTLTDNGSVSVSSAPNVVLIVSSTSVHVIDNAGGLDRWQWWAPAGCTVGRALGGSSGVLISYSCPGEHRLMLRDLVGDSQKWTVVTDQLLVPVSAGVALNAVDPKTLMMTTYSAAKGAVVRTDTLPSSATSAGLAALPASQTVVQGSDARNRQFEFVDLGKLMCLQAVGPPVRWAVDASGQPSLVGATTVATVSGSSVALHDFDTGRITTTVELNSTPPGDSRAFAVGAGLLLAGSSVQMYAS
jgi:hypothetical protein